MIFDHFPNPTEAARFASTVEREHNLTTATYSTAEAAHAADPFPYELVPPVVHVERTEEEGVEELVELAVDRFGGRFAGT